MNFMDRVRQAYEMEVGELPYYAMLAEMAPNEALREYIIFLQERQLSHAQYLASLLSRGAQSYATEAQRSPQRPRSFAEGIRQAWADELHQVQIFDDLVREAPTAAIAERLLTIEWDQMQHLVFFAHTYITLAAEQGGGAMQQFTPPYGPPVINL